MGPYFYRLRDAKRSNIGEPQAKSLEFYVYASARGLLRGVEVSQLSRDQACEGLTSHVVSLQASLLLLAP